MRSALPILSTPSKGVVFPVLQLPKLGSTVRESYPEKFFVPAAPTIETDASFQARSYPIHRWPSQTQIDVIIG